MIYFFLFVAALTAFSLSAFCGGGAGLLLIPILGYSLPLNQVPAALTLGAATSSFSRISIFFSVIRWDIAKLFLPTAILGVVLGVKTLSYLQPMFFELCIGIFLISNLPGLFRKQETKQRIRIAPCSTMADQNGRFFGRFFFRFDRCSGCPI